MREIRTYGATSGDWKRSGEAWIEAPAVPVNCYSPLPFRNRASRQLYTLGGRIGAPTQRKLFCEQRLLRERRSAPMPTQCTQDSFDFGRVEGRAVVADFSGGTITSNAGALLLAQADRAVGIIDSFAACFGDGRSQGLIEHTVRTMVGQRVIGIALGHEDLVDHDDLRHDPVHGGDAGQAHAPPQGVRAAGRQVDAVAAGAFAAGRCGAGAAALPQDQPRRGSDRAHVRRHRAGRRGKPPP